MKFGKKIILFLLVLSPFLSLSFVYSDTGAKGGILLIVEESLKEPFALNSYTLYIDGKAVYQADVDKGSGIHIEQADVDKGNGIHIDQADVDKGNGIHIDQVSPGQHTAAIKAEYAGTGYGIFTYHSDYIYPAKGEYKFYVEENKISTLRVICSDRGGFLSDLKKRPYIKFELEELSFSNAQKFASSTATEVLKASKDEDAIAKPKLNVVEVQESTNNDREKDHKLPAAVSLTDISFESDGGGLNVVLHGDGGFDDFNSFSLDKPPRIVVDLMGVMGVSVFNSNRGLPVNKNILDKIRIGRHDDKIRVVLDLTRSNLFDVLSEGNKLKITINNNIGVGPS